MALRHIPSAKYVLIAPDGKILPFKFVLAADPAYTPVIEAECTWGDGLYVGHYYVDLDYFRVQQYRKAIHPSEPLTQCGEPCGTPFIVSPKCFKKLYQRLKGVARKAILQEEAHAKTAFTKFAMPLIKGKKYPPLIANQLVSVQPLTGPSSLVYSLRSKYGATQ